MCPLLSIEDSDSGTSEMNEAIPCHMGLYNTDGYLTLPPPQFKQFFFGLCSFPAISEYVESGAFWPPNSTKPLPSFWYEPQHSWNRLPRWFHGKEPTYNTGVSSSVSGSRISPEGENGNPFQDSCLENSMREEPGWKEEAGRLQSVRSRRAGHMVYEHLAF